MVVCRWNLRGAAFAASWLDFGGVISSAGSILQFDKLPFLPVTRLHRWERDFIQISSTRGVLPMQRRRTALGHRYIPPGSRGMLGVHRTMDWALLGY